MWSSLIKLNDRIPDRFVVLLLYAKYGMSKSNLHHHIFNHRPTFLALHINRSPFLSIMDKRGGILLRMFVQEHEFSINLHLDIAGFANGCAHFCLFIYALRAAISSVLSPPTGNDGIARVLFMHLLALLARRGHTSGLRYYKLFVLAINNDVRGRCSATADLADRVTISSSVS